MPRNVRRYFISFLLIFVCFAALGAQTPPPTAQSTPQAVQAASQIAPSMPTSGDVMRSRISKAKALIALKNYAAAIFELENIRRETNDQTVHGVLNVLLMNCFLEQGDYKRAQDFLGGFYDGIKTRKPNAATNYFSVAGQVVKSARNQSDRYKSLGLLASDRNLPVEAVIDLDKMRETVEKVVEQAKTLGSDKAQTSNAFALLEEATNARSTLARDDYDSKRWKDEVADSRELLANSRSVIINAVEDSPMPAAPSPNIVASNSPVNTPVTSPSNGPSYVPLSAPAQKPADKTPVFQPVAAEQAAKTEKIAEPQKETPKAEEMRSTAVSPKTDSAVSKPVRERRVAPAESAKTEAASGAADVTVGPLQVGSLLEFATQKSNPVYPANARTMRLTGVVRVEVVVDERGQVAAVQNTSGPSLLQGAARDAVKKWKFKPFLRDGQPIKASGFLSFNFAL